MREVHDGSDTGPGFIRPSRLLDEGERSQVYRAARAGQLVRLAPDVLIERTHLEARPPEARHLLHIAVVWHRAQADEVLSHRSAAVAWGLPIYGGLPDRPEVTVASGVRRGSSRTFIRHRSDRPLLPELVHEQPVTGLARTVADVATTRPFEEGVVVADAALRLVAGPSAAGGDVHAVARLRRDVLSEIDAMRTNRGVARARRVVEFADPGAQLPGESISRCTMLRLGCPLPRLQHRIESVSGRTYYLDFYWPGQRIGAEFDGMAKYIDERFVRGRSPWDVLRAEKGREDELRLELAGYGRWGFDVARRADMLGPLLRRIGLQW